MSISPLEFLRHILDETNYLIKHSEGMSKKDFSYNDTLKRAFVRSLEIIGEAAKKIPPSSDKNILKSIGEQCPECGIN